MAAVYIFVCEVYKQYSVTTVSTMRDLYYKVQNGTLCIGFMFIVFILDL